MDLSQVAPYAGTGVVSFVAGVASRYVTDRIKRRADREQQKQDEAHKHALESITDAYWPIVRALDAMTAAYPKCDAEREKLKAIFDRCGNLLDAADKSAVELALSPQAKLDDLTGAADRFEETIERKRTV